MMNCNNANKDLGFDDFSKCDYNLHWSFSNFNRMLIGAGQIAQLPLKAKVLELGAGSSHLENYVRENFGRKDISFYTVDGDMAYEYESGITVLDISQTEEGSWQWQHIKDKGKYDAVVFMEVIEHIAKEKAPSIFKNIFECLKPEGLLLFTTPTPPYEKKYEHEVWPTAHNPEVPHDEIYDIINLWFKVIKEIGWSLEEREFNEILENAQPEVWKLYSKLKGAFPDSYIRAIISCISPVESNRQIFMICKKRREINGIMKI